MRDTAFSQIGVRAWPGGSQWRWYVSLSRSRRWRSGGSGGGCRKWQVNRLRFQILDAKARADLEDNFRKTIGQLAPLNGGVAVLGAAWVAYTRTQQTLEEARETSREQLISQQVTKAFQTETPPGFFMTPSERRERARLCSERWRVAHGIMARRRAQRLADRVTAKQSSQPQQDPDPVNVGQVI